jgi:hypothetical protein
MLPSHADGETTSFPPLTSENDKVHFCLCHRLNLLLLFLLFVSGSSKKKKKPSTLIHSSEQQMNLPSQSLTIYLRAARLVTRFLISVGRKSKENKAKMTTRVTDMYLLFRVGELVENCARFHYTTLVHYTHTYKRSTLLFKVGSFRRPKRNEKTWMTQFPCRFFTGFHLHIRKRTF